MARKKTHIEVNTEESPKFRLSSIKQREAFKQIKDNYITLLCGPAGSGKTLLACYSAISLLYSGEIDKIVVTRLVSENNGEKIGALPGEMSEKLSFVTNPLLDNLTLLLPESKIRALFADYVIEAIPISHLRGRSFHRSLIIVEECQNLLPNQIKTALTRIGPQSKIVLTGDPMQVDFPDRNGVIYAIDLLEGIPGCAVVELDSADIFRHPILSILLERAEAISSKYYMGHF